MKCERLSVCLLLLFFFLFAAGMFPRGSAAGAAAEVETSRAVRLAAEAPKTLEGFLRLVREWMDDPYMDGYEFAERIIGVDRGKWGGFDTAWGRRDYSPAYNMRNNGVVSHVSYQVSSLQIVSSNDHLWDIIISFPDKSFCVSAEMVREILGEPGKISKKMPSKYSEKIPEYTPVIYFRYKNKKYKLKFVFNFPESRFGNILKLSQKRQMEIWSYINNPGNEKNICANFVRFGTYEGRGEK